MTVEYIGHSFFNVSVIMILIIIALILVMFYGVLISFKQWKINRRLRSFIVLKDWSFIGAGGTFKGVNSAIAKLKTLQNDLNGPRTPIVFWLGSKLFAIVSDPDDLKCIFTSSDCFDKPDYFQYFCYNNGLPIVNTEPWKFYRRAVNPIFSSGFLNTFIPIFNEKAYALCDELSESSSDAFFPALVSTIMNQLIKTVFMSDYQTCPTEAMEIYDAMLSLEKGFKLRTSNILLSWNLTYQMTEAYQDELKQSEIFSSLMHRIAEKIQQKDEDNDTNLIDNINQLKKTMPIQKLWLPFSDGKIENVNISHIAYTMLFAGVMTSVTSVSSILFMLAMHPNYQDRVVDELRCIFETVDEATLNEQLTNMKFTELVIKESIRLFPALPINARKCTSDVPIKNGILPKHTTLLINHKLVNRDQKYCCETSNEFYPERFYAENIAKISPYSFVTFGMGRRNCVGAKYAMISLKVMMAHLLRHFKFTTKLKMNDLRFHWHFSGFFDNENSLQIQPRSF